MKMVNGSCGSTNGTVQASSPSTNLCASGVASSVTTNNQWWLWSCAGSSGGSSASCAAAVSGATIGLNVVGTEYSWSDYPTQADINFFAAKGVHIIRLVLAWEKLEPGLVPGATSGSLDLTTNGEVQKLKALIAEAHAAGIEVLIDVHDNGRYNFNWSAQVANNASLDVVASGQTSCGLLNDVCYQAPTGSVASGCSLDTNTNNAATDTSTCQYNTVGSANLPICVFADFWTKLAGQLAGTPGILGYDLMNEPNNMPNATVWPAAAQAAVNGTGCSGVGGIRSVDTSTAIYVEGNYYSSAQSWMTTTNSSLNIQDPNNNIVYEAHQYFDNSGGIYETTYPQTGDTATTGVTEVAPFLYWLKIHGFKGFLGEHSVVSDDSRWLPLLTTLHNTLRAAGVGSIYHAYTYSNPSSVAPSGTTTSYPAQYGSQYNDEVQVGKAGEDKGVWAVLSNYTSPYPSANGVCGSSSSATLSAAPTSNLCANGTASAVSGTGPWSWTCSSTGGGTTAYCGAYSSAIGVCGYAANEIITGGVTYGYIGSGASSAAPANTTYGPNELCFSGTASAVTFSNPDKWVWTCAGTSSTASCYGNTYCGGANGATTGSAPTTNLCAGSATASAVSGSGPWTWTCTYASATTVGTTAVPAVYSSCSSN